jgi:hypothetical protein
MDAKTLSTPLEPLAVPRLAKAPPAPIVTVNEDGKEKPVEVK